jgi:hypothetical protein
MKRNVILATTLVATLGIAACDGFKEALTAHVDVVARAGTQELSVTRLSDLLGNAKVPLRKDVASAVADIWISYQLLGYAAAHNDTLRDDKVADAAMWSAVAQEKSKAFYEKVSKEWGKVDTASFAAKDAAGDMYDARHILLTAPREVGARCAREDPQDCHRRQFRGRGNQEVAGRIQGQRRRARHLPAEGDGARVRSGREGTEAR